MDITFRRALKSFESNPCRETAANLVILIPKYYLRPELHLYTGFYLEVMRYDVVQVVYAQDGSMNISHHSTGLTFIFRDPWVYDEPRCIAHLTPLRTINIPDERD